MSRNKLFPALVLFLFLAPPSAEASDARSKDLPTSALPTLASLPVAEAETTLRYLETLAILEAQFDVSVAADVADAHLAAPGVLVTQLYRQSDPTAILFLFHDVEHNLSYFLRLETNPLAERTVRLWGPGPSEIVFTEESVRLEANPSEVTFRLEGINSFSRNNVGSIRGESSTTDTIACIARTLGISVKLSSLRSLLSSSACTASSVTILVLTAINCLQVLDLPTHGTAIALAGCSAGIAQAISCGYANCSSSGSSCTNSISLGRRTKGTWSSNCRSTHRSSHYAKFYTFQLSRRSRVTIDLDSSVDSYLYLLEGSGQRGSILSQDDDSGPGSDARISVLLNAGRYTVEATTYRSNTTGSFTLTVDD